METEAYMIGPSLVLLCHIDPCGSPNPHLAATGAHYPGPCLIIGENEDGYEDISLDILEKLPKIFERDRAQRESFVQHLQNIGANVVSV